MREYLRGIETAVNESLQMSTDTTIREINPITFQEKNVDTGLTET